MPKLVDEAQNSEGWFQAKLGVASASHAHDIMATVSSGEAASVKEYRAKLVIERLTGERIETYKSPAMQWGNDYEPIARLEHELRSGYTVTETGFWIHDTLRAGASPDGLIGNDGLLEVKCPKSHTHLETLLTNRIPTIYQWQMDFQMWITGRKWADFVSYDPRLPANLSYDCIRYYRDEERINDVEATTMQFLASVDTMEAKLKGYNK